MTIGLMSNARLDPGINWTTLAPPLFAEISNIADTKEVDPPFLGIGNAGGLWDAARKSLGCDDLFGLQRSSRYEWPLTAISALNLFKRKSIFLVDPWLSTLKKVSISNRALRVGRCFVPYREAYDVLVRNPEREIYTYMPFGIDTTVFRPREVERDIDIFWMGRRLEPLHQAILDFCETNGLTYLFRERTGLISDPQKLGELVSRSRYFVVTPPDLDNAVRTGGFSPLVMRYLEGLAGGARLVGVLPRSGEFEHILPAGSALQVAPDGSDFVERFLDDQRRSEEWSATVAAAQQTVLTDHSWRARAEFIVASLDQRHQLDWAQWTIDRKNAVSS